MNKAQCARELDKLGLKLSPESGRTPDMGWMCIIDAKGRTSVGGDCCGRVVYNYTCSASEFWREVINEAREMAIYLEPCPHPEGECEFHDE